MTDTDSGKGSAASRRHKHSAPASIGCAVVTISDTRDEQSDTSGALLKERLREAGHRIESYQIVRDDRERIEAAVRELINDVGVEAVLLSGGTGISPRDVTIEAIRSLLEKELPGFGELFRSLSYEEIGPAAMLSRAFAGIVSGRIIFALPGSSNGVQLALEKLILPELGHLISQIRGKTHGH